MEDQEIKRKIIEYAREHPNAADTVEGITQWWIGGGPRRFTEGDVERAAEQLVMEGKLHKKIKSDSTAMYFANPEELHSSTI